jgi:hypothetical protein
VGDVGVECYGVFAAETAVKIIFEVDMIKKGDKVRLKVQTIGGFIGTGTVIGVNGDLLPVQKDNGKPDCCGETTFICLDH